MRTITLISDHKKVLYTYSHLGCIDELGIDLEEHFNRGGRYYILGAEI